MRLYYSERDIPLVFYGEPLATIVVTVENYCKWYGLHLVNQSGEVCRVPFPDDFCQSGETAYCDHVPNPQVVRRWAHAMGYTVCDQSIEMIIGRWELEYFARTRYPEIED